MKKIFLALAAVAALAACSKTEYDDVQKEIAFAPVAANRTKAMVSGTTFPNEQFNVWGYYKQIPQGKTIAQWMASSLEQQSYIVEKPFTKKSVGLWGGVSSYFWPKVGSLMFAGYYPTNPTAAEIEYTFDNSVSKMTVTDYVAGNYQTTGYVDIHTTTSHVEDFMYFNMTPTSYNSTTQSTVGVVGNNVDVVFRHALSWINVVLVKEANTPNDAEITVHSVKFTSVLPQGDAVVDNTPGAATDEIVWTAEGTALNVEVCPNDDASTEFAENDVIITTTANLLNKQPLFIPQTMAGNLVVKYTITSTDGSKFTETKAISLSGLEGTGVWQPGKKYTYTITIGTSEILIDPTVEDWDEVPVAADIY